jgi:hypothetical protein
MQKVFEIGGCKNKPFYHGRVDWQPRHGELK